VENVTASSVYHSIKRELQLRFWCLFSTFCKLLVPTCYQQVTLIFYPEKLKCSATVVLKFLFNYVVFFYSESQANFNFDQQICAVLLRRNIILRWKYLHLNVNWEHILIYSNMIKYHQKMLLVMAV